MDDRTTKLGIMVCVGTPEAVVRAAATAAEEAGWSCVWTNNPPGQDGLTPASLAAAATARIAIGTGVVPVSQHAPADVLRRIGELDLPRERYRLGVGSGQGQRPVERVRAALDELGAAGTELVVGALGPRMCALAGEAADAVLLNAVTPDSARRSADLTRSAAAAAGRPEPRIYAGVMTGVGPEDAARLAQRAAFYGRLPAYVAHFQRMGVAPADVSIAAGDVQELGERLAAWRGVVDELTVITPTDPDHPEAVLRMLDLVQSAWPA